MKRKVIQIANSTQLVSLPRKWCKKYGIKKGDEMEVEERGSEILISTERSRETELKEINAEQYGKMLSRCIHAMYKQGVNEIKIRYEKKSTLKIIQDSLGKETVGYEVIDQGKNYCYIKNVTGNLEDFNSILRRTFLMLINMAIESLDHIKMHDYEYLNNVAFLEVSNNRFTTTCRRSINKKYSGTYKYNGPIYYIIEELENIADQYKYLCNYLYNIHDNNIKINQEVLDIYQRTNKILGSFYRLFYKFDEKLLEEISIDRKINVEKSLALFNKKMNNINYVVLHHQMVLTQRIFCLIGPFLVLKL